MTVAQLESPTSTTQVITLDDGLLVRLSGNLHDFDAVASLREALLTPRPTGVDDVIVDAGDVTGISDNVVAVLWAASEWAESTGGRFSFSRKSPALRQVLAELDLDGELPGLDETRKARAGARSSSI